jgi:hypothetical protein
MANIISPANSASTTSSVLITNGTIFESNPSRRYWFIQNVGTVPIFIKFGTGASSTSFNSIIHGGTSDSDGTGGSASSDNPIAYTGDISVYSTNLKIVAYEL